MLSRPLLRFHHSLLQPASCSFTPWLSCSSAPTPSAPVAKKQIDNITIVNGLPHITIPLPSREEKCVFALKPISNNVGDFLAMLKEEDRGIDRAIIKNIEGVRIASNTSIQTLFDSQFSLHINDLEYVVEPPALESLR